MTLYYTELKITALPEFVEILMAELGELGFDTFEETPQGLNAYAEEGVYEEGALQEIFTRYQAMSPIGYQSNRVEKQNWNEEWEKNYHPVEIDDDCIIRATFHQPDKKYRYEIVIDPKMTFGTGHHATTASMIRNMLTLDFTGKKVLDAGSGTGILAIMAHKLGAKEILACEIEDWSVLNANENAEMNNQKLDCFLGTTAEMDIEKGSLDILLANINRNVLLDEIPLYSSLIKNEGHLVLSGFYVEDIPAISEACLQANLKQEAVREQDRWVSVIFKKQ